MPGRRAWLVTPNAWRNFRSQPNALKASRKTPGQDERDDRAGERRPDVTEAGQPLLGGQYLVKLSLRHRLSAGREPLAQSRLEVESRQDRGGRRDREHGGNDERQNPPRAPRDRGERRPGRREDSGDPRQG
jgi:hypothetical protein